MALEKGAGLETKVSPVKHPITSISGFADHGVSVTTAQFCCRRKISHR